MNILYLFPDTNVFLQCKPLEQLDWSPLGTWDRIDIILSRPVQTEIDSLKGRGNSRQAARARVTSARIRELLQAQDQSLLLRERPTTVQLLLRHDLRRDESAADLLDYTERDDQLVGTALAFKNANPGSDVWLLTNDTGPMASAMAVGLKFVGVPENWLLAPEPDDAERREAAMKAELARFKSLEPRFNIEIEPPRSGDDHESLTFYRAFSDREIKQLEAELTSRFRPSNDFGPSEVHERVRERSDVEMLFAETRDVFQPATPDEIAQYRRDHKAWIKECLARLAEFPQTLNALRPWPKLTVCIENTGSRPAIDALVVVEMLGSMHVMAPYDDDDSGTKSVAELREKLTLPPVPVAPKGHWKRRDLLGRLTRLSGIGSASPLPFVYPAAEFADPRSFQRDPNAVYFKAGRRGLPSQRIEYECSQWRHAQEAERFEFEVRCPAKAQVQTALLKVEVHAANLTQPTTVQYQLRFTMTEASCLEMARAAISDGPKH